VETTSRIVAQQIHNRDIGIAALALEIVGRGEDIKLDIVV